VNQRRIFDHVFTLEAVIASVVFVAVLGAVVFAVVHRRARPGISPSRRSDRHTLERYCLAALGAIAVFLVVYTALENHREHRTPQAAGGGAAANRAVRVEVTAFQWCWKFTHRERTAQPVSVTSACRTLGDIPTLVVPTGRPVRLEMTSTDVIHSVWVPELRYKMDAFPHQVNSFTITLDREGEWIGRCAEFCGDRHFIMDFRLRAVSPEEYETWLDGQAAAGGAGAAA
jgi:cytochrome c oxidase subunit 2